MITKHDLDAAIAECQGKRNPDSSTCIKLAAFYTIKEHLFPERVGNSDILPTYSYAPAPNENHEGYVTIDSDTEFAQAVDGRKQEDVWPVIDELMTALKTIQPRLYDAVLSKL